MSEPLPTLDLPFGTVVPDMVTPFTTTAAWTGRGPEAGTTWWRGSGRLVSPHHGGTSTLRDEENIAMFEAVVEAVGGRAKVIAGTGMNDTGHSVHLSELAAQAGVDGLLLVTPYYNKPNQAGIRAHFETIASSTDLPVMLYDIPGRSVMPIDPDTIIALAKHPNIVALKDAKGDFQSTTLVVANTDLDVMARTTRPCRYCPVPGRRVRDRPRGHPPTCAWCTPWPPLPGGRARLHFELDPTRAVDPHPGAGVRQLIRTGRASCQCHGPLPLTRLRERAYRIPRGLAEAVLTV